MKLKYQSLISVEDLSLIMKDENIVILDCRYYLADLSKGRKEYLKSHIPGAFFMDIGYDLSSPVIKGVTGRHPLPNPEILSSSFRAAGLNMGQQVIVYDQSNGAYAARAWWLLRWLGHDDVALLNGGFEAWKTKGLTLDNQWPAPKKGNFKFNLRPNFIVSMDDVAKQKENIIDSRDYNRYIGETEPIDPVAGHIPKAVCIPYMDNTDDKGYWKSPEFLKKIFGGLHTPEVVPPVFYCGSGVTACHNILAYKIATGNDAMLYPGSWSEWINYFPAATGP